MRVPGWSLIGSCSVVDALEEAAVDGEVDAVDVARGVPGEERDRVGDVGRLTDSAQRDCLKTRIQQVLSPPAEPQVSRAASL